MSMSLDLDDLAYSITTISKDEVIKHRDRPGSFTNGLITVSERFTARLQRSKDNHRSKYKNYNQNVKFEHKFCWISNCPSQVGQSI